MGTIKEVEFIKKYRAQFFGSFWLVLGGCASAVIVLCFAFQLMAFAAAPEPFTPQQETTEENDTRRSGSKWLPIPIFLTEPAFGYGLGLTLAYIKPEGEDKNTQNLPSLQTPGSVAASQSSRNAPPDITGVAGGHTDKGTWFAAVGHSASWRNDTIRYAGALIYADVKSTYYVLDRPFDFDLEGFGLYQDLKFRLGDSRFFLGGKLVYLDTESALEIPIDEDTAIPVGNLFANDAGLAIQTSFDTRDNTFTPNSGLLLELVGWRYDEAFGGDYNYWKGMLKALSFHHVHSKVVIGMRLEASAVDGRPPFYAYPWVTLRGIPAMRYQGKGVGMVEVETRWNILERWAVLAFAGAGTVYGDDLALETRDDIVAGGIGGRYLFMPEEGLWLGLDVARGTEDVYVYVTVGHAW